MPEVYGQAEHRDDDDKAHAERQEYESAAAGGTD